MRPVFIIHPDALSPGRSATGATVVEVMIGMALGMIVVAALGAVFASSINTRNEIERAGQQIESGRYALELLRDEIHQAGHFNGYTAGARQVVAACIPRAGVPLSAVNLGWQTSPVQAPLAIYGYAGADLPASETCLSNQKPNTDALILRRVESSTITVAEATAATHANDYFMQTSACANSSVDTAGQPFVIASGGGSATASFTLHEKDCATSAPLRRLVIRAYYVGKCGVCSGSGDGIPSLRMAELSGAVATSVSLVEGIESMRVEYSLDSDHDGQIDAVRRCKSGIDPCTAADWASVVAVQVRLLARNLSPSAGYRDTKTYDMGLAGTIPAPNDAYKRHLYGAQILAFNLAGLHEP